MKDELQKIKKMIMEERIIECEPLKIPKCWICKDHGLVYYSKQIGAISYDFAYKCTCKRGQINSDSIPTVPRAFGEKVAMENYRYFSKEFQNQLHLEYK